MALCSLDTDWLFHDFLCGNHLFPGSECKVAFQRSDPRFNCCCIELDWCFLGARLVFDAFCELQQDVWGIGCSGWIDAVVLHHSTGAVARCRDELRITTIKKKPLCWNGD